MGAGPVLRTDRLDLTTPVPDDLDELHAIHADPRVWTHFPSLRHQTVDATRAMLDRWIAGWQADGLGTWTVRRRDSSSIIGCGGCSLRQGVFWDLGYRFDADVHGNGYATEPSLATMTQAGATRPELPIVAYLLEHNVASARVAEKVGLTLVQRAADAGNPDPNAIRLVCADRRLSDDVVRATLT